MEVKAEFLNMIAQVFAFLDSFWDKHRFISIIAIIVLLCGLYHAVKAIICTPHTIFYLIYGIIAGMAVVWLGTGPSGLDIIRGADDLVVGLTFGAVVGFLIGLAMTFDAEGAPFYWSSIIAIPLAVLSTCICLIFLGGTIMALRDNLITGILCLAFFGAIVAPVEGVIMIFIIRK